MKHLYTAILALAIITLASCRQDREELLSYNNTANMMAAKESYGEQFKVMWNAMNTNYAAWEIEDIDWDNIYTAYYPRFVELDTLASRIDTDSPDAADRVTEIRSKAQAMYEEILSPLHDGHMTLMFIDPLTKESYAVSPAHTRNQARPDFGDNAAWDLSHYIDVTNDIEADNYIQMYPLMGSLIMDWLVQEAAKLQEAADEYASEETHTATEEIEQFQRISMISTINRIQEKCSNDPSLYKDVATAYNNLIVPNHPALGYSPIFADEMPADMLLFITKDGICYMRISKFLLGDVMSDDLTGIEAIIGQQYQDAWQSWHNTIYQLQREGKLKGVIFDMRNNGGGSTDDFKYVAGSVMAGKCVLGTMKSKNGIGRLDYSPAVPFYFDCHKSNTESITAPIIAITNVHSVSMAEMTTIAVKQKEGGISLGTTTWGGCTTLITSGDYSELTDYAGTFGVQGETPVFGYFPYHLCLYTGMGAAESKGFTPDIEVRYDADLYNQTGRDNQLERAFQYLRTGR